MEKLINKVLVKWQTVVVILVSIYITLGVFAPAALAQDSTKVSRITNFKATTDPGAANPGNFSKTFTFTYTPKDGDPELKNFKVSCGGPSGGTTDWGASISSFKCTYPKEPAGQNYTVTLNPVDPTGATIGLVATLSVAESDAPPTPTPTPTPTPAPREPFKWDGNISITNNSSSGDLVGVISRIILWLLGILALVAAIIIIYAGILLVFNGGNEKRVTQAKSTLLWAIIGLVVSIGAFALVNIIQQVLG